MNKRKRDSPPGDIRQSAPRDAGEQPLDEQQKALVSRAYSLFDDFVDDLRDDHCEMRDARAMRALRQNERSATSPPSNTLNSCIDNVIADQIDNMPEALMLPEREDTANSAEEMSDVVSFVLYQSAWPEAYQTIIEDAAVTGTGIAQVFWDDDADDGNGMVSVLAWHPEDFYPDPTQENIQDGRACFKVTHTTVEWVEEHYPHARGYVHGDHVDDAQEIATQDVVDGDSRTTLIEFWYKRYDAKARKNRVHMAQMAGHALLYSTELCFGGVKEGDYPEGVYAHGEYPFVLYKYRSVWRRPFGTGLVHDYIDTQTAIDRMLKYIDDNARASSVQRIFVRKGSGVNPDDVADMRKRIIEWEGSDVREAMQVVQANPINNQVYTTLEYLVDSMKQDCGQNQFSRGEGGLGVTAAAAIQALQEAGGKTTRWHTERFKNAFRRMVEQILWVLSDYLDADRRVRIVGGWDSSGNMKDRIVELIAPTREGGKLPKPAYTVRVQVQKNNPLQIQADNEFLMQVAQICGQAGQALPPESVISLMEGYRTKSSVLKMVKENSQQQAMIEQMQAQIEALTAQNQGMQAVIGEYRKADATPAEIEKKRQGVDYSGLLQSEDSTQDNPA